MNAADSVRRPRYRLHLRHRFGDRAPARLPWYVIFLLAYLAAILVFGKGPTYFGVPPLYWGEAAMLASLVFIAPWLKGNRLLARKGLLTGEIVVFFVIGAVQTSLSFSRWGIDAIRDAAVFYYAAFYFVGLGLASRERFADRTWFILRVVWIVSLLWNTADTLSAHKLSELGPPIPGRGVPLLFNSVHEGGQNLALGAWVVLCTSTLIRRAGLRIPLVLISAVGLIAFGTAEGRGMRIGMAAGVLAILPLGLSPWGPPRFNTRLLRCAVIGMPVIAMILIAFPERAAKLANLDRFREAEIAEGTAGWRLMWWQNLYSEVMRSDPVFGLGFGESLHVYQPLLASQDEEFMVRSPHNINVTIFARMGILGFLVWASILVTAFGGLFARIWNNSPAAGHYSPERRDELVFWLLMLVATVVNSSFGVLMEGPVLGIPFWFALGFASARSLTGGTIIPMGAGLDRATADTPLLRRQRISTRELVGRRDLVP